VGTHVDITVRKKVEEALQESETKFRQLAENMREVFWLREKNSGEFIYVNPAFSSIWGRTPEELYQNQNIFMESIHWEDLARLLHGLTHLVETGKMLNEEFRVLQPDGSVRWIWMRAYPIIEGDQFFRIAGIAEDATDRKKVENALRDSERRYRDLIEHQGGGVSIIDPHQTIVYMNPAGEEIFGVPRGTLASRNMKEFLDDAQFSFMQSQSNIRQSGIETSFELIITRPDKGKRSLLITATPRFDVNGQFLGVIIIFRDITQRKQTEDRLRYISLHDTLTELYNRAFFEDEITRIEQVGRFPVSIVMVDVDGLKQVNDQMGHDVGDQMLRRTAAVLKDSLRSDDVVARLGGDEFAILMPNSNADALENVLTRIQLNVAQENERGHNPFTLSLSAGGATCMQRGSLRETMKEADQMMYRMKEDRKKRFFFTLPVNSTRKQPPKDQP
jgi:diguanylate cyclase (GGDEF)-like protein/PAS domain S-box-containing protein